MSTWGGGPCSLALSVTRRGVTIFRQPFLEKVASEPSQGDNGVTVLCYINELSWLDDGLVKGLSLLVAPWWSRYAEDPVPPPVHPVS